MRPLVAVVLVAALAPAAPVPKALKKATDAELLVGRWKPADGSLQWYEFKGDGTLKTWIAGNEGQAVPYGWEIDSSVSPKRLTLFTAATDRPEWVGIYELDGDSFKFAYLPAGKGPPGSFDQDPDVRYNTQARATSAK